MLKEERRKKGMSQMELSVKADVSFRMIQKYEQGDRDINNANLFTLCKLSIALQVPIWKIVSDKDLIRALRKERSL